jgi:hypothetical protein
MSAEARPVDLDRALEGALDLAGTMERHPIGTLAAAVGAGYVLGGGLFTPLTGRLVKGALRLGLRFLVLPVVERELVGVVESLVTAPPDRARVRP